MDADGSSGLGDSNGSSTLKWLVFGEKYINCVHALQGEVAC